jgi:hypothetical protein
MRNLRQSKALARLKQLKEVQTMTIRRQTSAALAQVAATEQTIEALDSRVAQEASGLNDYADTPALGRWADLMDRRRLALQNQRSAQVQQAEALAEQAAAAELVIEQYDLLLQGLQRQKHKDRQRAANMIEWEAIALSAWTR